MKSIIHKLIILSMPIFIAPSDPTLNLPSVEVPIEQIPTPEIQSIIDRMMDIALRNQIDNGNGVMVGLAAPQIGISSRIILVDMSVNEDRKNLGNLVALINPEINWYSDEISYGIEGCYSVDDHLDGKVPRAKEIRVIAFDRKGNPINETFSGFKARILQHEIDHLNGIRFPDRVGKEGTLHWIPDNQYHDYMEKWEGWPLVCPWDTWIKMKEGSEFEVPQL